MTEPLTFRPDPDDPALFLTVHPCTLTADLAVLGYRAGCVDDAGASFVTVELSDDRYAVVTVEGAYNYEVATYRADNDIRSESFDPQRYEASTIADADELPALFAALRSQP